MSSFLPVGTQRKEAETSYPVLPHIFHKGLLTWLERATLNGESKETPVETKVELALTRKRSKMNPIFRLSTYHRLPANLNLIMLPKTKRLSVLFNRFKTTACDEDYEPISVRVIVNEKSVNSYLQLTEMLRPGSGDRNSFVVCIFPSGSKHLHPSKILNGGIDHHQGNDLIVLTSYDEINFGFLSAKNILRGSQMHRLTFSEIKSALKTNQSMIGFVVRDATEISISDKMEQLNLDEVPGDLDANNNILEDNNYEDFYDDIRDPDDFEAHEDEDEHESSESENEIDYVERWELDDSLSEDNGNDEEDSDMGNFSEEDILHGPEGWDDDYENLFEIDPPPTLISFSSHQSPELDPEFQVMDRLEELEFEDKQI